LWNLGGGLLGSLGSSTLLALFSKLGVLLFFVRLAKARAELPPSLSVDFTLFNLPPAKRGAEQKQVRLGAWRGDTCDRCTTYIRPF